MQCTLYGQHFMIIIDETYHERIRLFMMLTNTHRNILTTHGEISNPNSLSRYSKLRNLDTQVYTHI